MMQTTDWHNCYDGGWQSLIVPAAFRHPAKFSLGLITRIYRHGLDCGYWRPGDLIGDCFGGVGLGGIVAAYHFLRWVGVELESEANGGSPFVELARANFDYHRARWHQDEPHPVIVQGDSRRFAEIVGEVCGVVTSPPYATDRVHDRNGIDRDKVQGRKGGPNSQVAALGYGSTEGQIGGLREGNLDAVVTSPPFTIDQPCASQTRAKKDYHAFTRGDGTKRDKNMQSEGNIAGLPHGKLDAVVTSPPYAESIKGAHGEEETAEQSKAKRKTAGGSLGQSQRHGGYGVSDGQIGALKEGQLDGCVTSPPYEGLNAVDLPRGREGGASGGIGTQYRLGNRPRGAARKADGEYTDGYGASRGQIGYEAGETYWQAMAAVYHQMFLAMRPNAVAAIVVKDYVKQKARVPLCDQTCALLERVGFTVFERTRAHLVKRTTEPNLFGAPTEKLRERKSFFRRLAEKNGSPRIDYEEVIWCRKL